MKEDSEEARLMGNKTNSNSMAYTDGPKAPLAGAAADSAPTAPPAYQKTVMGGSNCHGDTTGMKSSAGRGSGQSQESELLGDLMSYNAATLMTQFHADALKQVGYGRYQILMITVAGLALTAQVIHIFSFFFVLPSADLEFCMIPRQKAWLIGMNFIGLGFGAMNAGAIAEINGRKWTLLSCLSCMTLFSVVSAFMPTYGPFAMARFCASICAGGIFPIGATYVSEMTPGNMRSRSITMFTSIGLMGGSLAAAISILMLPMSGEQLMLEHRKHFSAWHRYLLVMTLSSIMPIIGLLTLPESPRWLLDVGREVEALEIYQRIYCSNSRNSRYTLTELELPGVRSERHANPKSVLSAMGNNAMQFFASFASLIRLPYGHATNILWMIWCCSLLVSYGLTVYILKYGRAAEEAIFSETTLSIFNNTFENITFSINIVNQNFESCRFNNCTFEQIFLSYVHFNNCTFTESSYHAVKTGNTTFLNTVFNNVNFIDTDLDDQNFINCIKNNTKFDRMEGGCDQQFDFNTFNKVDYHVHIGCMVPCVIALAWAGITINRLGRIRMATLSYTVGTVFCCAIGFLPFGEAIYWFVGVVQALILIGLIALTVFTTEYYCTHLRCTALGVCVFFGYIGAVIGGGIYNKLPVGDAHMAALISIFGLTIPSILTSFLKERSQFL